MLHRGQDGVPEEGERQHHEQQTPKAGFQEHADEEQGAGERPETHQPHPLTGAIPSQPQTLGATILVS